MENHEQVFHPFLRPLEIPQNPRDSHIPTATTAGHSPHTQNPKTRKEIGRCAASSDSPFHDHSALESKTDFMIIRGLENAWTRLNF
jgi:hypothetical protein